MTRGSTSKSIARRAKLIAASACACVLGSGVACAQPAATPADGDTPKKVQTNPEDGPTAVKASLVTEFEGLIRGEENIVGVRLEIIPGWHVYWTGQNDSGEPVEIELTLPDGLTAQDPLRPTPARYIMPGDILDHVHEEEVTLLIPVTVPDDAEVGSSLKIDASVFWLVCADVCVPGFADLTLTTTVIERTDDLKPGPGAKPISKARGELPIPLPKTQDEVRLAWLGDTLVIEPMAPVHSLEFYPAEGSARVQNLLRTGVAKDAAPLRLPVAGPAKDTPLSGIIRVVGPEKAWVKNYEITTFPPRPEDRAVPADG